MLENPGEQSVLRSVHFSVRTSVCTSVPPPQEAGGLIYPEKGLRAAQWASKVSRGPQKYQKEPQGFVKRPQGASKGLRKHGNSLAEDRRTDGQTEITFCVL